jgi:hypothetical protein
MGWWRTNDFTNGQMALDKNPRTDKDWFKEETPATAHLYFYNGDGPADLMGMLVDGVIDAWFVVHKKFPTYDYIREYLGNRVLGEKLKSGWGKDASPEVKKFMAAADAIVAKNRTLIEQEYQLAIGRAPRPQEWQAVLNFVFRPELQKIVPSVYSYKYGKVIARALREARLPKKKKPVTKAPRAKAA